MKKPSDTPRHPATRLIHGAETPLASGDITPAIQPSTTFARTPAAQNMAEAYSYRRTRQPNDTPVEALLTELEGGRDARLFASGMAAAMAVVQTLHPGDRIVAPSVMYWGLRDWLRRWCPQWGLSLALFDASDATALERVLQAAPTALLWLETPCNPTWDVLDIAHCCALGRAAGALTVVDSTVATPILTQPLQLGADLVMHSATKYLNGHSDVLAGALITRETGPHWDAIVAQQQNGGATLSAFDSWLLLRGMRTLALRVARCSASALAIAQHFEGHPALQAVCYPGLPSHPQHDIARRQMQGGFSGMLSLRVKGGAACAQAVAEQCQLFRNATSLGGVESLIEHRYSIEGPDSPVPPDLLRLSVGIEDSADLISDLQQALDRAVGQTQG